MAIVYLSRRATFSAAHRLHSDRLDDEENRKVFGKCNNPRGHGHNYELDVVIRARVDAVTGMAMNLVDLKKVIEENVVAVVDHKHLNDDVPAFASLNPTAENMAVVFWKWLEPKLPRGALYEVRLRETENNVAIYRGEG
jgi:6-pyruvoyltetrahydropterin/6-carboxytetrahydropterin synthase